MDRIHEELKVPIVELHLNHADNSEEESTSPNGKSLLGGNESSDGISYSTFFPYQLTKTVQKTLHIL